jgi:hypothetical protein
MRITNTLTGEFEDKELDEKQLALFPLAFSNGGNNCFNLVCNKCPLSYSINGRGTHCDRYLSFNIAKSGIEFRKIELLPIPEPTEQDIMSCKTIGDLPNGVYCYENTLWGDPCPLVMLKYSGYYIRQLRLISTAIRVYDSKEDMQRKIDWKNEYFEFLGGNMETKANDLVDAILILTDIDPDEMDSETVSGQIGEAIWHINNHLEKGEEK